MTNSPQASWKAYEEGAFYTTHLKGGHHPEGCVCGGGVREMSMRPCGEKASSKKEHPELERQKDPTTRLPEMALGWVR